MRQNPHSRHPFQDDSLNQCLKFGVRFTEREKESASQQFGGDNGERCMSAKPSNPNKYERK